MKHLDSKQNLYLMIFDVKNIITLSLLMFLGNITSFAQAEFITVWDTTKPSSTVDVNSRGTKGKSTDTQIYFPGLGYKYTIVWEELGNSDNNGMLTEVESSFYYPVLIDFGKAGTYVVKVQPKNFTEIQLEDSEITHGDREKLIEIQQWGDVVWEDMYRAFQNCINLKITASDVPNLKNVELMQHMFSGCTSLNADLSGWDVSHVTDLSGVFEGCTAFNGDVSTWEVGNVLKLNNLFNGCTAFKGDLSQWDVSQVTDMYQMFNGCTSFNSDLSQWDVSQVTDMFQMFNGCTMFNSDISGWDVSKVEGFRRTFKNCSSFSQNLGAWNLESIDNDNTNNYYPSLFEMLYGTGMTCFDYNETLKGWAENPLTKDNLQLGADGLKYGDVGKEAREVLRTKKMWKILGDQYDASCNSTSGIDDIEATAMVKLYPNPAEQKVIIELIDTIVKAEKLVVIDQSGKTVLTHKIDSKVTTLDVSHLSSGAYMLRIGDISTKLVKK